MTFAVEISGRPGIDPHDRHLIQHFELQKDAKAPGCKHNTDEHA